LEVLRRLVDMLPGKMTPGASVLLEIGEGQAQPLVEWIGKSLGFVSVEVIRDLARKERLLHVIFGEDS
jgi:methylase of polypeptide subunit release factors